MPRRSVSNKQQTPRKAKERFASLFRVAKISHSIAPSALYLQIVNAVLNSLLPLATTYFAAQTTTELANAYSGTAGAGEKAIMFVLITSVFGVVTIAWSQVERYISSMARYKVEAAISDRLIEHFLALEYWRYDDKHTADLFDKSTQFSNFFTYIFDTFGRVLTAIFTLISSMIALFLVSWWLGLILFIAVLPGIFIQYKLSKARTKQWAENVETRRKTWFIQNKLTQIDHIAEVRLYGLVKFLLGLRRKYRDEDQKNRILIERGFLWKEFIASVIESAAEVAALVYITLRIIGHTQPVGQFLYVQQVVSRGLGSMRDVASSFITIDEDLANLPAYDEFMKLPIQSDRAVHMKQAPQTIAMEHVSFKYPSTDRSVLEDISLEFKLGEHVAIVGENGAGKSTLVKLLLGFYQPTKGVVTVDGVNLGSINLDEYHAQIAVLQQDFADFDFANVRENITYGDVTSKETKARYEKAVNDSESAEFIAKLPKKDESYIARWMEHADGTNGIELSGGQSQRLALARNFYRDSPIVILDEPTSAIDALAESRIFKRLFTNRDKLIISISHRLTTVRRADIIYVVEHGKIVEQGTHAELVAKKGAYYRLFESQL